MTSTTCAAITPPEWTLLYHAPGKIKGRGEFLRLMLEDAGVAYVNSDDNLYGPTGMMDAFRGSPENAAAESGHYPVFFPPGLWHRPADGDEVLINQVGACMIYLGDQLGYAPQTVAEKARANSIMLNALDYVSEGRSSFHPVQNTMSYSDQKEQGDKVSKEFSEHRMKLFLHHFNKVVKTNPSPESPIAGGSDVTYADFALFHSLDATASQFNSDFYEHAWDNTDVPELKRYYEWIKARPKLQVYFQSDRCARKCILLLERLRFFPNF
jgi:glutathione S-transferase